MDLEHLKVTCALCGVTVDATIGRSEAQCLVGQLAPIVTSGSNSVYQDLYDALDELIKVSHKGASLFGCEQDVRREMRLIGLFEP